MATPRSRRSTGTSKKPNERVGLGGGSVDKHLSKPKMKKSNVWATVGDGNTIVFRAVDTEDFFKDGYVHPVDFQRKDKSTYVMDVRCLDPDDEGDPCPGCRDDLDRRYKFWLLGIVRNAEKMNKSGKVIGKEDQLRILSGANRLVKALNGKHKRRDLSKRDIEITQNGEGFDVEYEVEWADDEDTPLTKDDKALVKDSDDILEAFEFHTSLKDEDEFYDAPASKSNDDDDDPGERTKRRGSAFSKTRKTSSSSRKSRDEDDDDEDEDDEDERPARSRKTGGALAGRKGTAKPKIKSRKR
jgi:hypothetical protein